MRTHLEFRSPDFLPLPSEEEQINPGRHGKRLAEFLARGLAEHGFDVTGVDAEDWGWRIDVGNAAFPVWIGCGNYEEYPDGFLCFIEPSKPFIRKFFKRIETTGTVERVANALEQVLRASGKARDLKWWTGDQA